MSKKSKILIVFSGVTFVLAGFGTVAVIRGRSTAARDACIQNIRVIEASEQQLALKKTNTPSSQKIPGHISEEVR